MGIAIGFALKIALVLRENSTGYRAWKVRSGGTGTAEFVIDPFIVLRLFAWSFGSFVAWTTSLYIEVAVVCASVRTHATDQLDPGRPKNDGVPEDMSAVSLHGGELITAGATAFLSLGRIGLYALTT